jgi:S-layer protein (TIGR01567 family)
LTVPNKEVIYEGTIESGDGYQINDHEIYLTAVSLSNEYASFNVYENDTQILSRILNINDTFVFSIENQDVEVMLTDTIISVVPRAEVTITISDSDIIFMKGIIDSHKGKYVWNENSRQSSTYVWDGRSFSGFYYDIDTDTSSEWMKINLDGDRGVDEGNLIYESQPIINEFEYAPWGNYLITGFMTEKYFVGYESSEFGNQIYDLNLMSAGQLSKVLIDDDESQIINVSSSLDLEAGYVLNIQEIDVNGERALVELTHDGDEVDSGIISSNDGYVYEKDVGSIDDLPIIVVHFNEIYNTTELSAVSIKGIFQISEDYQEVEAGDIFGQMKVSSISSSSILMENYNPIYLLEDRICEITESIVFEVADSSTLRFAPALKNSEYEKRGTVSEKQMAHWNSVNFEGFYYNIDNGFKSESLSILNISERMIHKGDLIYNSTTFNIDRKFNGWGNYKVMGLFGEGFVPITNDSTAKLFPLLMDDDSSYTMRTGETLELEEGYGITPQQIDVEGNKVWLELTKDGAYVDDKVISADNTTLEERTWYYEQDVSGEQDVLTLMVHVDEVFKGQVDSLCIIEGVWQISDNATSIVPGDSFNNIVVDDVSNQNINMSLNNSLTLDPGSTINIMDNIYFKVADDAQLRYYPFVKINTTKEEPVEPVEPISDVYTMSLQKGWNLVSIPIIPVSPSATSIFENNTEVLSPIYSWNPGNKQYYEVENLEIGKGYWILAMNDTDVEISGAP